MKTIKQLAKDNLSFMSMSGLLDRDIKPATIIKSKKKVITKRPDSSYIFDEQLADETWRSI